MNDSLQSGPPYVTGPPVLKLRDITRQWWQSFLHRLTGSPRTTLVGILGFLSGAVVFAGQLGYTLGTTPNGRKGAEVISAISALLVGVLGKDR